MAAKNRRAETLKQSSVLMTLEQFDPDNVPEGGVILRLPCDQLSRDDHQPRTKFHPVKLQELADSIENQGLQQYPVVNFWKTLGGDHLFKIKAGERRWRAHGLLKRKHILCIVEPSRYSEKYDSDRALAQAAENDSRENHTTTELINLVEKVIATEKANRVSNGTTEYGAIQIALRKIERALGQKPNWAVSYHRLSNLTGELRDMLDADDENEPRLKWGDAISLAGAPKGKQEEILRTAMKKFPDNPNARRTFIGRMIRETHRSEGRKPKGRGSDDKARFIGYGTQLRRLGEKAMEGRPSDDFKAYSEKMLQGMKVVELEGLIRELVSGVRTFFDLYKAAKAARNAELSRTGLKHEVATLEDDGDDT